MLRRAVQDELERLKGLKNSPKTEPPEGNGWDEDLRGFMELVPIRIDDLLPSKLPVRATHPLRKCNAGKHGRCSAAA